MAATIKDIARRLNVSVSTVSYALNDGPRSVAPEVKAKILAVAEELDYRPNRLARSLVTRRTLSIGFVPNHRSHDIMLSPYLQVFLNAIVNELEERGFDLVMFTAKQNQSPASRLDRMLDGRVDGLIFLSPPAEEHLLTDLDKREFPYVTVAAGRTVSCSDFSIDNAAGMNLVVDHLERIGHRHLGLIGGMIDHRDANEREAAFNRKVQEYGLITKPEWQSRGDFTYGGGEEACTRIITQKTRPTAIICANDESASGAMKAIREFGLRIPDDISITGFDDLPMSVRLDPPLTTVCQPVAEIGTAAVAALMEQLGGGSPVSQRFEPRLVVRGSTACPPEDIYP